MNLFCVGISHHTANVATRERYACEPTGAALQTTTGCEELLLLTTCNRVEVYAAAISPISTQAIAEGLLREVADCDIADTSAFYRYEAEECVKHLFRVASGLDSMVVGETEILGQAKKAYELARREGRVGPHLWRACRSDRSQSISQKRFLEHWTIERFLFWALEKRASARRARSQPAVLPISESPTGRKNEQLRWRRWSVAG